MKTLFLVRHAKSSRDDPGLSDLERPLNERGLHDAPMMGERLAKRRQRPDLILSSPARRALGTAELLADRLGYPRERIVVDTRLYAASASELLAVVGAQSDVLASVMLCGHNPEMGELARCWSSQIADMPTCAVARFAFDIDAWRRVADTAPVESSFDTPKNH